MPYNIPFWVLDSFTDTPFQGNPAGVFFIDHAPVTENDMRRMAGEVSLESAFVFPVSARSVGKADFRLRYFTGVTEVPLCGHATVAAVTALVQQERFAARYDLTAETNVGLLKIRVDRRNNRVVVTLEQNVAEFGREFPPGVQKDEAEVLAAVIGCRSSELGHRDFPLFPQVVSTGTPWLLVPVRGRDVVDNAPANLAGIKDLSEEYRTYGFYVFSLEQAAGERWQTWGRCFAPIAGLDEDPVTGSASGALGCYLAKRQVLPMRPGRLRQSSDTLLVQQGFAGGRGGTAHVTVFEEDGKLRPYVTGEAVLTASGTFYLP
ncbi:MAG: PhzF family isomerase [Armatimonadaceae bacterium]